jgi:two-component system repressor protein LuxO
MLDALIIEDTLSLAMLYKAQLDKNGFQAEIRDTGQAALDALGQSDYSVILLDLGLPDMDGLEILDYLAGANKAGSAVITTADASLKRVIEAMRLGAADYLVKPFSEERLVTTAKNAAEKHSLSQKITRIERALPKKKFEGFVGSSTSMQAVYNIINNVAASKATVFITGESGTGKEVTAEAIHNAGRGKGTPFVAVNCGAIPRELFESELFGHKKGSFTGAIADYAGAAKRADGGTLFLDEICEMELDLQTKLLRFLQTETIQPVGGSKTEQVDVRVVCATNRNPLAEVKAGRFREDLFYRLNVIPIELPPLRERGDDVLAIAEHFLKYYGELEQKDFNGFDEGAQKIISHRRWSGNVRELQNAVRQVSVMLDGGMVSATDIPQEIDPTLIGNMIEDGANHRESLISGTVTDQPMSDMFETETLAELERLIIERRIELKGSIPKAATSLDVSPSTIYRKQENWD